MKLIVAGATGFVGTEVIRQALSFPAITSIVALARRVTPLPQNTLPGGADATKLKSVVCEDFGNYSESVKKDLANADACIWLVAVTPSKLGTMTSEEARKICLDYTVTGIETITQLPRDSVKTPFRFIYVSGAKAERDQTQKPWPMGEYSLMRGEAENRVIKLAKESKGAVEACVAKPGLIDAPGRTGLVMKAVRMVMCTIIGLPQLDVSEISATLLDQVVNGFEKEPLLSEDMIRIGRKVLADQQKIETI